MSETLIKSNQFRAVGDTSLQTLINPNQVRQAGDTSSQTLINKNQIEQVVPSRYTVVDYIQSSGTQYIDTGYKLKAHDKVEITFSLVGANHQWDSLFGARLGSYTSNCYAMFSRFFNNNLFCYARTGKEEYCMMHNDVTFTIITKDVTCTIYNHDTTETNIFTNSEGTIEDCVNTCGLFVLNTSSSQDVFQADVPSIIKLNVFKIYDNNNVLIRDFKPVLDSIDNKYKLYEIKTATAFENAGTRDFAGGNYEK